MQVRESGCAEKFIPVGWYSFSCSSVWTLLDPKRNQAGCAPHQRATVLLRLLQTDPIGVNRAAPDGTTRITGPNIGGISAPLARHQTNQREGLARADLRGCDDARRFATKGKLAIRYNAVPKWSENDCGHDYHHLRKMGRGNNRVMLVSGLGCEKQRGATGTTSDNFRTILLCQPEPRASLDQTRPVRTSH